MTASQHSEIGPPILPFPDAAAWEAWLVREHTEQDGVWLQFAKRKSGVPSVTYEEAVEVALCYGWIDSQKKGYDETYWLQKFTPRRPNSKWSQSNRERVERLLAEDRMQPAGLREVDLAKANGQWDAAYAGQAAAVVPPDLQAELDANPQAAAFFARLTSANRYAILHRLETAKKPETRQKRLRQFVEMLEREETIYPQ